MGEFRNALMRFQANGLNQPRFVASTLLKASGRLPDAPPIELPSTFDLDALAKEIKAHIESGSPLSRKELRQSPWCLWGAMPPLASTQARAPLLAAIAAASSPRPLRTLASAFLQYYDPDADGMTDTAELLASAADRLGKPWAELHRRYMIFDIGEGPRRIAAAAIASRKTPSQALSESGLGVLASESAYATFCAERALRQLAEDQTLAPRERFELVQAIGVNARRRLVFEQHAPLVADALLLPYRHAPPEYSLADEILKLALDLFKDPRLHPGGWARMEDAAQIVRRWLVGVSLRQFFDVVDEIAPDHMWKYRRAFWEAVEKRQLIKDARVVFGKKGAAIAQRQLEGKLAFSAFEKGGGSVQAEQAVLLMRIGDGVVAEWSHNGKCVIWNDAASPNAPRLHQRAYSARDLKHPDVVKDFRKPIFAVAHLGAWQLDVARKIEFMTGVRLSLFDYKI